MDMLHNFGALTIIVGGLLTGWTVVLFFDMLKAEIRDAEGVAWKGVEIVLCLIHLSIALSLVASGLYISFM